jgi:hypothetical protein
MAAQQQQATATQQPTTQQPIIPSSQSLIQVQKVNMNTSQELIVITEDKARICLMNHVQNIEKRNAWMAPAGILATLIITLATTTTKDFIFSADVWQAIFAFSIVLTLIWLVNTLYKIPKSKKIDDVLTELKSTSVSTN